MDVAREVEAFSAMGQHLAVVLGHIEHLFAAGWIVQNVEDAWDGAAHPAADGGADELVLGV
jgi:hypothetical protein